MRWPVWTARVRFAIDEMKLPNSRNGRKKACALKHRADLIFFIRVCLFFQGTHEGFAVDYFLVSRQESNTS